MGFTTAEIAQMRAANENRAYPNKRLRVIYDQVDALTAKLEKARADAESHLHNHEAALDRLDQARAALDEACRIFSGVEAQDGLALCNGSGQCTGLSMETEHAVKLHCIRTFLAKHRGGDA